MSKIMTVDLLRAAKGIREAVQKEARKEADKLIEQFSNDLGNKLYKIIAEVQIDLLRTIDAQRIDMRLIIPCNEEEKP